MNKGRVILLIVLLVIVAALAVWLLYPSSNNEYTTPPNGTSTTAPASPTFDQSISDGTFTITFPSSDFGLATNETQILVHSYIPPCDQNFNYCLYYIGNAYLGTNFESAGIRIEKRPELASQSNCLTTEPSGYGGLTPIIATSSQYAASVFSPLGDAAAGHYSTGALYRVYYQRSCYEFETRIGQTQFANYPSGTIQQFTTSDQAVLQSEMQQILQTLTLPGNISVTLPQI